MSGATVCDLPDEVLIYILRFLPRKDIVRAASVCRRWAEVVKDRRVWRGKGFLYLSGSGRAMLEALLLARVLPVLKSVIVHREDTFNVFLTSELAIFQVPRLQGNLVKPVIYSLVTEHLSIDFSFLGYTPSTCLIVQLHRLKQLEVRGSLLRGCRDIPATEAKLRALASALSRQPLLDLQSADISFKTYLDDSHIYQSDLLAALVTCPALGRLSIQFPCCLSWDMLAKFSKLRILKLRNCVIQIPCSLSGEVSAQLNKVQVLELQDCLVEDIRFLDWCPQLRCLSLIGCNQLRSRELSRKSDLRSLTLPELNVSPESLNVLRPACPQLQGVLFHFLQNIGNTLPIGNCSQLNFTEVHGGLSNILRMVDLPSELTHLKLRQTDTTSDELAEIVRHLPHLKILDISEDKIRSLHFLRHCAGLTELSLVHDNRVRVGNFHELGGLGKLHKLSLKYGEADFGPLAEVLHEMPHLKSLEVTFWTSSTLPNLSLIRHCRQLQCLIFQSVYSDYTECLGLHELANLKELRKVRLDNLCFGIDALESVLPSIPHLKELHIVLKGTECDFSFLCHCPQLMSLRILFVDVQVCHFARLCRLKQLKQLVLERLPDGHLPLLVEQVRRMPQLKYLSLQRDGHNFLLSSEFIRLLSSSRSQS